MYRCGHMTSREIKETLKSRRQFWAFALVLLLLTWGGVVYKILAEREAEIALLHRDNLNLARTLKEHTLRTLKSVDQTVLFLKAQYEKSGGEGISIADYVQEGMIIANLFNQLGVIDAQGRYVLSSLPNHKVVDLSDREHFLVHKNHDCRCLFVSKPVLGRATGKWSLQLTRRINQPDGSFGGVVVISLDPFYFINLYKEVELSPGAVIELVGDDGVVRAKRLDNKEVFDAGVQPSLVWPDARHENQPEGVLEVVQKDGGGRFYAYQRVDDFPLRVILGVDRFEALKAVRYRALLYVLFGLLITGVVLAFVRVTTRLQSSLLQGRDQAQEANRLKSEFLASMSHELRTPLNGIIGFAEMLRDEAQQEDTREYSATILDSAKHLLALLNSVLDLAKIEAGHLAVANMPCQVQDLVKRTHAIHSASAAAKGLVLTLTMDGLPERAVMLDGMRLTQVLNNLVHNAVKFTTHGHIDLRAAVQNDRLFFSVTDTGPGIEPQDLERIFDKFQQVDSFESRRYTGTGLGLTLSRELVRLMGGRLMVKSRWGHGSEFFFTLPLKWADETVKPNRGNQQEARA